MLSSVVLALVLQTPAPPSASSPPAGSGEPPRMSTTATLAQTPPVIDGRDDDEIWRQVTPITDFRQWQPTEDAPARYRTEAKVAYDPRHIYVFVRAYDPHPDSIPALLARRDTWTASDKIWVMIDSYHDRRSGFEFGVNPVGVKFDMAITNDGNEDDAWDAVWDVATTVDSLGWTAEYRIPLSQLRYARNPNGNTFGFMIIRDLQRYTERDSWPLLRRSRSGFPSQFGELTGLVGLDAPRRLEATPYVVTRNESTGDPSAPGGYEHQTRLRLGGDLKYGITSNLTLGATINPDFGQVEADPSVLNLSAFETFFQERRPFFVEGTGIWNIGINCSVVNCSGENLFYSRRIGRRPTLGGGDDAQATTILGAAKVSGRLSNGLSIGVLDALTRSEENGAGDVIEPMTNYMATRLQQDFRNGQSGIGAMITNVHRNSAPGTDQVLHSDAWSGALDFRHQFANRTYQLSGKLAFSRVDGTPEAILATQTSSVHYFQRPDDGIDLDPTRTSLTGSAQEIQFGKRAGQLTRFETGYQRRSAGFEINDLGFLRRADQQSWNNWFALQFNRPASFYQRGNWNFNYWQFWTSQGMPTERAFNTNVHFQLNNRWWVHAGGTVGGIGKPLCDNCTRGGPALRGDISYAPWAGINGDDRKFIMPELFVNYNTSDAGNSDYLNINSWLRIRLSQRIQPSIGVSVSRNRNDSQFYRFFEADSAWAFARLEQTELSVNFRINYTFTPALTLQVYAAPFVSKGTYSNVRELSADPRAEQYADRYQPYGGVADPGGFNFKDFNSNVVLRWEYRPGSTLFVVWNQGRQIFDNREGPDGLTANMRDVYNIRPRNTLLIKASYWLSY